MTDYTGEEFRRVDSRVYQQPDGRKPYGEFQLRAAQNQQLWINENRGSHCTYSRGGESYDLAAIIHNRPVVSVTGFSSLWRCPYWVQPGLSQIQMRIYYRVSIGRNDDEPDPTTSDQFVILRAGLVAFDRYRVGGVRSYVNTATQECEWTSVDLNIDSVDTAGLVSPVLDVLTLEVSCELNTALSIGAGYSSAQTPEQASGIACEISPETFFADDSAALSPEFDSNWICGIQMTETVGTSAGLNDSFHDIVLNVADSAAVIYPWGDRDKPTDITKRWSPYIQVKALEVREVYE